MGRSSAIAWKAGLAVAVAALSFAPLPAQAEDGPAAEPPIQPIEQKAVPVILMPPADGAVFGLRAPEPPPSVHVIAVQPSGDAAIPLPRQEPADVTSTAPAAPTEPPARPAPVQPAGDPAIAAPDRQPADASSVEPPSSRKSARIAAVQPAEETAPPAPRTEQAKPKKPPVLVEIPSLPERSPFRQTAFKSEIVDNPNASPVARDQPQESTPILARVNSAFRSLTNLLPGSKKPEPVSQSAGSDAGAPQSLAPPSASSPAQQNQVAAAPANEQSPAESKPNKFLETLQFWKK